MAVFATAFAVLVAAGLASASTTPQSMTLCRPSGSPSCTAVLRNATNAVNQAGAPGIATAYAQFSQHVTSQLKGSKAGKAARHVRTPLSGAQEDAALPIPGYGAAERVYIGASGQYTYDPNSAVVTADSQWDMASCSKIMATNTAVAQLYQAGYFDLDDLVASPHLLGPNFATHGKGVITVRQLLLHEAGFGPDPVPGYSDPAFPCPNGNNKRYHPTQNFDCVSTVFTNLLLNQTLAYTPGTKSIYSDLSFITLMFIVAKVTERNSALVPLAEWPAVCQGQTDVLSCYFYAYVHKHVFKRYGLDSTSYLPENALMTPPEWFSESWRHQQIVGVVSDQNAYAMGGISGHAGVFSSVKDALTFMSVWMNVQDPAMLNASTVALFITQGDPAISSRALGWDTNNQVDPPCGSMSPRTFLHIGYTGTQFCGDPTTGVVSVLLANGRYPNYLQDGMIWYRPQYNSLVQELLA
jgi:CubicO group peptidase (beta-lactamase class C family)